MSSPSGRDYSQPRAPGPAPEPVDASGEPVGYDLEAEAMYEQPPAPPEPYRLPAPRTARPADVIGGFVFTLAGLATFAFIPPLALGLGGAGAVTCAVAMVRSRRGGPAINRRLAIAGIVIGLAGFALAFLMMMDFSLGHEVLTPS
jgi:hypothetical protein